MKFLRSEIQKALVQAVAIGEFYGVTYDAVRAPLVDDAVIITPSGVTVNEAAAAWEPARNRRHLEKRDRVRWSYQVTLEFDREVIAEAFELALAKTPVRVVRDATNGLKQQATMRLASASYEHPPRQAPNGGSRITYDFDVDVTPL